MEGKGTEVPAQPAPYQHSHHSGTLAVVDNPTLTGHY